MLAAGAQEERASGLHLNLSDDETVATMGHPISYSSDLGHPPPHPPIRSGTPIPSKVCQSLLNR
jgi:hypothetical protein